MKSLPKHILARSITVLCLAPALATAATTDLFDGAGTPATSTQLGAGAGASIQTGGPTGDFLRLTTAGQNGTGNHYTYNLSDPGAWDTITAQFDFRILSPGADGFSFALIPTSAYGAAGDGPDYTAEEPDVPGLFAFAFDLYDNLSNVSAHWNGSQISELAVPRNGAPGVNFRDNGLFNHATAEIQRVGNGSNLILTLTSDSLGVPGAPYKALEVALPNMLPYESRVQFAGRTGGVNQTVDLDNVNVAYSNAFTGLAITAPAGHLSQNFDSVGTTNYRALQNAQRDDVTFRPGPVLKGAEGGSTGAYLRLASEVGGENNQIAFDRASDGGISNVTEVLKFDARFTSGGTPADGLGVLFLPTSTQGFSGNGIASSEAPNHPGILGVGFDIYDNGGGDQSPGISLHWDNAQIADVKITDVIPSFQLNQFSNVEITRTPVTGGLSVSVNLIPDVNGAGGAPVSILSNVFVAGASNYDNRVQFSARTGGAFASHDLDNIASSQIALAPQAKTVTNFSTGNGSGWKAYYHGAGLVPAVLNDAAPNGNYLRLAHDGQNGQRNSVAFDQQTDGQNTASAIGITADFDFRLTSGDAPADGFSLMLIPTDTYGTTGPGATAFETFNAETPNLSGVFGLGFALYNANRATLHWDGNQLGLADINPASLDLDSGVFNHASLSLTKSGGDMLASLFLTSDSLGAPGTPFNVFTDVTLPGMGMYDYRVEFTARTGGADMSVDLDNISVATVPEPGSAVLLALGFGTLLRRRRK